jgi:hypothetical protein
MKITKARTSHELKSGATNWVLYSVTVSSKNGDTSTKKDLSINTETFEVYNNCTGVSAKSYNRYRSVTLAIGLVFGAAAIQEFNL